MSALFSLQNKVAVITGSSRGIGRAIAEQMALAGAKVVISSRKADACEEVAAAIRGAGGEALVIPANISDKAQLQNLVDAGNTVVVKPSEFASASMLGLVDLFERVGFPKGVVNVVTGFGHDAGAALVEHPLVKRIAFTGGNVGGR